MANFKSYLSILVLAFLSTAVWVGDAQAYIEPGTGSMIIQSLVAVIAGGLFLLKTFWFKIKSFFSKKNKFIARFKKGEGIK